jgi:hypothetical protein
MSCPIGIRAWGAVTPVPGGRLPENLEPISTPLVGRRFRKIGRFIQLALSGAATTVKVSGLTLPTDRTGVFLGSGIGNTPDLVGFAAAVISNCETFPSAVQFAHSVGNSGAFYVAQAFELTGPVLALSQEDLSFECALWAARGMLEAGDIDLALVGGVDVLFQDDAAQRRRMGLADDFAPPLSEGTGWLLLERRAPTSRAVLGEVFIGADHPAEALARQVTCCPGPSGLAIASRLSAMADAIAHAAPGSSRLTAPGTFPTETAVALCGYLDDAKAPPIFHSVSATRDGFIGVVSVARASP